jgi:hypothetical protein
MGVSWKACAVLAIAGLGFLLPAGSIDARRTSRTIHVHTEAQFATAVAKLRWSGGTIVLAPRRFRGELLVGPRGWAPLRIVGRRGTHVEQLLLWATRRVSVGNLTVSPVSQDARIEAFQSTRIDLHDLTVTAAGTRHAATVQLPLSNRVTIRRSTFTHCGDRAPQMVNCLFLRFVSNLTVSDNRFQDCRGCDFINGRFRSRVTLLRNHFARSLPCRHMGRYRCGHQDLVQIFGGRGLLVRGNTFGVYRRGAAQLYITNRMRRVRIVNNLFLGTDPRVPRYHARVAMVIGSAATKHVPRGVRIINNTILTGARRVDGYEGSIRMTNQYGAVPKSARPVLANNVIAVLKDRNQVCSELQGSVTNVILEGEGCSDSDIASGEIVTRDGRPTKFSAFLLGRADPVWAPPDDITGRRRGAKPDIGAFQYFGQR